MDLKQYIRRGKLDESREYRGIVRFRDEPVILAILEGRGRRKTSLGNGRTLFENYQAPAIIGLEDCITNRIHQGAAGVYPGSHYALWEKDDFITALNLSPELARRSILELSRRIRLYDMRERTADLSLSGETDTAIDQSAPMLDEIYEMSFNEFDEFPEHIIEKLKKEVKAGDSLLRQGDSGRELYIIVEGRFSVFQTRLNERLKIDTLETGDMAGEMGQFDGLPRSADVVADCDSVLLEFSPTNFHFLFQLHPRWSFKLLETLATRIDQRLSELADSG